MVHNVSVTPCSVKLPEYKKIVDFWDWMGEKRIGSLYKVHTNEGVFDFFIEYKTGYCFSPVKEVSYWKQRN